MSNHPIEPRVNAARVALIAALCAGATVALADTPTAATTLATPTALLQDFVGDARVKHSMEGIASHSTVMVQSKCDEAQYTVDDKFEIVRQPTFDSSGNPTSGAWKQAVSETGCKDAHVLNVFVQVKEGGGLAAEPLLPGATHLDPVAQKEGIDKAVSVASEVPGSGDSKCRTGYVADTKFIEDSSAPAKGATGPQWKETWTLISCRRKFLVPMAFELSDKGVHIFAGPVAHVKLIPLGGASEFVGGGEFMGRTTSGH